MNVDQQRQAAQRSVACLETDLRSIEVLIIRTPTGPERNKLCDAQIHVMAAIAIMKDWKPWDFTPQKRTDTTSG